MKLKPIKWRVVEEDKIHVVWFDLWLMLRVTPTRWSAGSVSDDEQDSITLTKGTCRSMAEGKRKAVAWLRARLAKVVQ